MNRETVKVGIIGCGNISTTYLKNMTQVFDILEVVACADLLRERAQARAQGFEGVEARTVESLLADPAIEIVVNLTPPGVHAQVALAALRAGRSVYNEKPLAVTRREGRELLETAKAQGVLLGCAPDTFLGGGLQTCRKLIDDGWIGEPVAAAAFMMSHGHESWHPDPEFFYKPGGGPMFDMGPYYLTALVSLIGPVRRATGSARVTFPERTITSEPKAGHVIEVEVSTHIVGVMDFAGGAVGTIITSFDVWDGHLPRIEVYGTEGSLTCPDPNTFGGPVLVKRGRGEWAEVPLTHGYTESSRGLGVADMAYALRSGRAHRASGRLAYHVLDLMCAFQEASDSDRHVSLESTCERPAPLPLGLRHGEVDE